MQSEDIDDNIRVSQNSISAYGNPLIEKVVASGLIDHMTENNLMDPYQSAYRKGHSTETGLVRVHNDIVSAVDKGLGGFYSISQQR